MTLDLLCFSVSQSSGKIVPQMELSSMITVFSPNFIGEIKFHVIDFKNMS